MTSALGSEALLAPLRDDPARAAILLDVDGTLAPIVDQPSAAQVPASTREVLTKLVERYGLVACVSGRRASEARALVSIGSITYLGSHGAELLRAGAEPVLDPRLEDWTRRIHDFGRRSDTTDLSTRRVRLEDKGAILAYHWRSAPDEDAARAAVETVAGRAQALGFRTHWGRKVLEVRPPVHFDKGAGVKNLLDGLDLDAVMYAGDDLTDVDAFRSIIRLAEEGKITRAIRVGVESPETPPQILSEADVLVDGTDGVRQLLSLLLLD